MKTYLFGPVRSRRLGLSLGVDLITGCKTCNLNCVYCELGRTLNLTSDRKVFVETKPVLDELKNFFDAGGEADYITFSGAGEPTLALNLGEAISGTKRLFSVKTALITNAVLFYDSQVRAEAALADVVLPSLDAGSEAVFKKLNRPHRGAGFKKYIEGFKAFAKEYKGELLVEVLLVKGINDSDKEIANIGGIIKSFGREAVVQLNTVARSAAEKLAEPVDAGVLKHAAKIIGGKVEIIGGHKEGKAAPAAGRELKEAVLSTARLRPVTIDDITAAVAAGKDDVMKAAEELVVEGALEKKEFDGKTFYRGAGA